MEANSATGTIEGIGRQDHSLTSEYRLYGPPGTGKTTHLTRQIRRAVDKYGADRVLVTSFSRAAAAELAGRDLPIAHDRIGTLHSHCWHALGGPEIAESNVDEWNRENPQMAITPKKKRGKLDGEDSGEEDDSGLAKDGDDLLQQLSRFRGMQIPRAMWSLNLVGFEQKWTEYKRANGLMDFTDLIDTCYRDLFFAPKSPSVIFADEAQDLNRMQLSVVRKWGEHAQYFIVCGDDDQCQPPGTMVRTTRGDAPIEGLDPARDRLAAYAAADGVIYGSKKGFRFRKACHEYNGRMLTIRAGSHATRSTPEHKFYVRWVKGEALDRAHVVYLMQQGDRYRVGWCKLIRADGIFHLGTRAHIERADAAWILRVFYDRTDASIYESYVAAKYGLPLAMFKPNTEAQRYTQQSLDRLFEMLKEDLPSRACACLADHGRDLRFPLYSPARAAAKRGGSTQFITEAANLVPEIMSVPVACGRRVEWLPLALAAENYCGPVYALDVEKYHTYVADGIVSHNCIYSFSGATPEAFLHPDIPDDHKIILKQSYRVPRAVHALAERTIRQVTVRQEKMYLPRPEDGHVSRLVAGGLNSTEYGILKTAEEHLAKGQTVMFLASCSYMLKPLIQVLRTHGIPFHNPYRRSNGFWNPLRLGTPGSTPSRVLALLVGHPSAGEVHRPWTQGDVALWADWLASNGVLRRGAKKSLHTAALDRQADLPYLDGLFEPGALESLMEAWEGDRRALLKWWRECLTAEAFKRTEFAAEIASRHGANGLVEAPRVVVGTIHSVKGGEADVVYLFPDLSRAGDAQYQRMGPPRDSVVRLFYVGMTRARHTLYICQPETPRAFAI